MTDPCALSIKFFFKYIICPVAYRMTRRQSDFVF